MSYFSFKIKKIW